MKRRGFLKLLAGVAGIVAAPAEILKPMITVPEFPVHQLSFHPDAFHLVMGPVKRMDVLYGFRTITPKLAARISG